MWKLVAPLTSKSHKRYQLFKYNKLILLVLSIGMLLFISGCGTLDTETHPNSSQSQMGQTSMSLPIQAQIQMQTSYAVGETIKLGDLQYRINSVRTSDGDVNCENPPKSGKTFLLLDLTIENHGSTDTEVRSMSGFRLYDKNGRNQAFSMGAAQAVNCDMNGTLTAGGIMRGELGYEVVVGDQSFRLKIYPNPFSSKMVIVEIPMSGLVFDTI